MVGLSGKGSRAKAIREFKATGNKAMASGAFQKAMRQYTKALELDPGNALLYSNRSAAHFNLRQFAESLEDAESAILCDNMWWKAYKRKGLSLIHMQRYDEAIEALEEGLKIVGKNAEMEKNLEFARACQEQAQNLYILPEPHMMQRLESVPVFIVTDDVGQPFFVTYEDGQQVCTFYFDQADANATLEWIKTENKDLGDTARVIHITLNQAFNLAQETQKQYYEETTRAAAEIDRRVAEEAAKDANGKEKKAPVLPHDVDGSDEDIENAEGAKDNGEDPIDKSSAEGGVAENPVGSCEEQPKTGDSESVAKSSISEQTPPQASTWANSANKGDDSVGEGKGDAERNQAESRDEKNEKGEESIIDENAPLSFQFRPELRQVQVAVDLLNKHPNPPVRPILRDPPSVRKAKAEAAAAEKAAKEKELSESRATGNCAEAQKVDDKAEEDCEGQCSSAATIDDKGAGTDTSVAGEGGKEVMEKGDVEGKKSARDDPVSADKERSERENHSDKTEKSEGDSKRNALDADDDDVELTVDNFNGIPIFQAKGLTLLQNNKQLIPLFFSKWDLETAWQQLTQSHSIDVPAQCEVDVGTLEDVLRRMSESKTDEFESVFFVPSREAMKAIGAKFPLDDLTAAKPVQKPVVRKAAFSRAKQIAARGGTKEEVRAAIREDLELHVERQRMAEIIAQIEQARRTATVGGVSTALDGRRPGSGRIDRTARRNAQRKERKQAAKGTGKAASGVKTGEATRSKTSTSEGTKKSSSGEKTTNEGDSSSPVAQVENPSVLSAEVD